MSTGLKANVDGSAAIQVGGVDAITLTSAGAASFVTSPMTIQGGSAAAPSLTFSGDTNTGIFSPAADTIAFSEGGVESMRIDSAGNVGIGTTSPNSKLEVSGSSTFIPTTTITADNAVTGWRVRRTGGTYPREYYMGIRENSTALDFYDNTANALRARIDSSGNLLVGTTTADLSTPGFGVDIRSGVLNGVSIIKNDSNWGTALFIRRNTGVGTGTVAEFNYNGTTTGTIGITATTTAYNTSSDYRLKDNVQPMTGALAKVALLKPCNYTWKADGSDGEGFIAHELAEICPQAVTGEKDAVDEEGNINPQGIDTSFLVATLTAAIQELKAELDATKAEVALLKGAA